MSDVVTAQRAVGAAERGADGGAGGSVHTGRQVRYELVSSVALARGPFWRTKVVSVQHRTSVLNGLERPLLLAQLGSDAPPTLLAKRAICAWHWPGLPRGSAGGGAPPLLCVTLADADGVGRRWHWSAGFRPDVVGECVLKLRSRADNARAPHYLARAMVSMHGGALRVTVRSEDPLAPPFQVVNRTARTPLRIGQRGVQGGTEVVAPGATANYAFDEPAMPQLLELSVPTVGVVCTADMTLSLIHI